MREIKFRTFDFQVKQMFQVKQIQIDVMNSKKHHKSRVYMQYTGLKDKNGVEIYEGDIIATIDDGFAYVVMYYKMRASFVLSVINPETGHYEKYDDKFFHSFNIQYYHSSFDNNEVEVIGNIYQNKELLND